SAVTASSRRRPRTDTGDTKSISCPKTWLTPCHTSSQNTTAHIFIFLFFLSDLSAVIEIISRYFSTYGLGILPFQHLQIAGKFFLHLFTFHIDNIAFRKGCLCHL